MKLFLAVIIFAFPSISFAITTKTFSDISNYQYGSSIEELATQGIMDGYADGTFKPDQLINRAEFLKIILVSSHSKDATFDFGQKDCFPDVKKDQWFAKYVCFAFSSGIIQGYPDGFFRPEKNVDYAEAIKMLYKSVDNLTLLTKNPDTGGAEDESTQWFAPYFYDAQMRGIALKELGTQYEHLLTRGEMAEIINRFLLSRCTEYGTCASVKNVVSIPGTNRQLVFSPDYMVGAIDFSDHAQPRPYLAYRLGKKNAIMPFLEQVDIYTPDAMKAYAQKCLELKEQGNQCTDINFVDDYAGLKQAFVDKKPYKDYEFKNIGQGTFLVISRNAVDPKFFSPGRYFITFIDDKMVVIYSEVEQGAVPRSDALVAMVQQTSTDVQPFNNFSFKYPDVYPLSWEADYENNTLNTVVFGLQSFNPIFGTAPKFTPLLRVERKITKKPTEIQQFIDQKLEHLKQANYKQIQKIPVKILVGDNRIESSMIYSEYTDAENKTALEILTWFVNDNRVYFFSAQIDPKDDKNIHVMEDLLKSFKIL